MNEKRHIDLTFGQQRVRVGWYSGTEDSAVYRAILDALGLASDTRILLRDNDGMVIAIADNLPNGLALTVELLETASEQGVKLIEPRGPRPYPIVGNLPDIADKAGMMAALTRLTKEYGDFVKIRTPRGNAFINCDADVLLDMVNRPSDFPKIVSGTVSPLLKLREGAAGNGLFTADDTEEIWHVAHRILSPALGIQAIKQYYPRMLDVADELLNYLGNVPDTQSVLITDIMTRMTFEAIAYTGFDTRFDCVNDKELPSFVQAMVDVLTAGTESFGNILPDFFHPFTRHKRERGTAILFETVDTIIRERREALLRGESVPNDILQTMLTARDKQTGQRLPDDNIRYQLITFLVAGHETTSGLLSYAMHAIATHPEVEEKIIAEVDAVLGRDYSYRPTFQDIEKLDYINRVLKEALRLNPTAPAFAKLAIRDTVVAGKYAIAERSGIITFLPALHRHPKYWGEHSEEFDPERFLPEAIASRHPNAYHPFGIGMRSCIGFQFAVIEARMVIARFFQRYRARLADPNYTLEHVHTLTIKPKDLFMHIEHRTEEKGKFPKNKASETKHTVTTTQPTGQGPGVCILYGSNMGASQDLANRLAREANALGLSAKVTELDQYVGSLPTNEPVLIVTSTYNGLPPDNATQFAQWITNEQHPKTMLSGVKFAVLGCGNRQWKNTFQKFPKTIEQRLVGLGAQCILPLGQCDADGDFEATADAWCRAIWPTVQNTLGVQGNSAQLETQTEGLLYRVLPSNLPTSTGKSGDGTSRLKVLVNRELQAKESNRSTRHIEVELAPNQHYSPGDHLGIWPQNPQEIVHTVATLCKLSLDQVVCIESVVANASKDGYPIGQPLSIRDLLTNYVDLTGMVSRRELRILSRYCPCPPEKIQLERLQDEHVFKQSVVESKLTVVDLLQKYRSIEIGLDVLLSLRPCLKPRYYSISSSPKTLANQCSITVGVHTSVKHDNTVFNGLCSNYLANLSVGNTIKATLRDTTDTFHLPQDPSVDVILVGPGTGVAPLRGFIQERVALRKSGVKVGETWLYFGCRDPKLDYLYQSEFEGYLANRDLYKLGVAFSRIPGKSKVYVSQLIHSDGAEIFTRLERGAYIYICGDAKRMAPEVFQTFVNIVQSQTHCNEEQAKRYMQSLKDEKKRYLEDVWA